MKIITDTITQRVHAWLETDQRLSERLRLSAGKTGWRLAILLAHSGDSWLWAMGLGLLWLFGQGLIHRYAAALEISVVIQALLVFALKRWIRRERPAGTWGGIYRQYDPHSFPSGHATRAALLACMAALLGPGWFGGIMMIWAPLVCLSRVATGVHYLSDIVGGIVLGLGMGLLLTAAIPIWIDIFPFLF